MEEKGGATRTSRRPALPAPGTKKIHKLTRVYSASDQTLSFEAILVTEKRLVLGREPGADGWKVDDPDASRRHAEIVYVSQHDGFRLKDLGSKNGTFLNAQRVGEAEHLQNGSVLRIGQSLIVYETIEPSEMVEGIHDCPAEVSLARFQVEALTDIAARSHIPILVLGPSGAGKEVLARRIHEKSGRTGPMVALSCATFSKELLSSELFGHEKGAFSGALHERVGLFRSAMGGTLFLDEIAELPLDQQAALLRAIEERRVRPLGSDREIDVDVRLISATHQDLFAMEKAGTFRGDLLARISGFRIDIPPLSARRVEILPLLAQMLGDQNRPLACDAAEALLVYAWPRNIRELRHVADNVALFASKLDRITAGLLPSHVQSAIRERTGDVAETMPTRNELIELLRAQTGNVAEVARLLGKHRNQVYRWLKIHGLDAEEFR